jgi:hypothetical protein
MSMSELLAFQPAGVVDSPFIVLSFLAAPALLTNASTLLALSTSNRLARASDRARAASAAIVGAKNPSDPLVAMQQQDFQSATRRSHLLIRALRRFYLAAGCFALGTCVALLGAFAGYFGISFTNVPAQIATMLAAVAGVGGLVHGAWILLRETQIALVVLEQQHAAITAWRATHVSGSTTNL